MAPESYVSNRTTAADTTMQMIEIELQVHQVHKTENYMKIHFLVAHAHGKPFRREEKMSAGSVCVCTKCVQLSVYTNPMCKFGANVNVRLM